MYIYYVGGMPITDELYHDDLDSMTFGRRDQNELYHYGIKGQSWGKRRFQNEDGSLTAAGRQRYDVGQAIGGAVKAFGNAAKNVAGEFSKASAINRQSFARSNGSGSTAPTSNAARRSSTSQQSATANKVSNSANNGRKAADNLFNRVGNAVSGAASSAKSWGTQAAKDVGSAASNAYGAARDWTGQAVRDVDKFVDQNVTGNSARDRAEGLNKAADYSKSTPEVSNNLRNEAQKEQNKADKTLFGRIGNAAKDVGNWASERASDVANTANNVGNWAGNQAGNVKDWYEREITGDRYRRDADRMRNDATVNPNYSNEQREAKARDYEKEADNSLLGRIRSAGDAVGNWGRQAGKDIANTATSAANSVGDWGRQAGRDIANTATNAANAVGDWAKDTASGIANTPEYRDAANAVNNAIDWAGNRVDDVKNWGQQAGRDIVNTATNTANNISDWYTGQKNGDKADSLMRAYQNYQQLGDQMVDRGTDKISDSIHAEPLSRMSTDNSAYAQAAKDRSNQLFDEGIAERNRGYDIQDQAYNMYREGAEAQKAYANAPRQRLADVGQSISDIAKDVGNWAGDRAKDVGNAATNAGNWVGDRASDVGNWLEDRAIDAKFAVNDATKPIRDWYTGDADKRAAQYNRNYAEGITNWAGTGDNLIDYYKDNAEANRKAIGNTPDRQTQYYQNMAKQAKAAGNYEAAREWQAYAKEAQKEADKKYEAAAKQWDAYADSTQRELDRYNNAAAAAEQRYNQAPRQVISNLPSNIVSGGKAALDKLFKK